MRLLLPALLLSVASAAYDHAGAQAVIHSITAINNAVTNLTSHLQSYNGGIIEATPSTIWLLRIHSANRKGYAEAIKAGNFSQADSQKIANLVTSSVAVTIPASCKVVEKKKPLFVDADLNTLILASLRLLLRDHETFSVAVGNHLYPSAFGKAAKAAGEIIVALDAAIADYMV